MEKRQLASVGVLLKELPRIMAFLLIISAQMTSNSRIVYNILHIIYIVILLHHLIYTKIIIYMLIYYNIH